MGSKPTADAPDDAIYRSALFDADSTSHVDAFPGRMGGSRSTTLDRALRVQDPPLLSTREAVYNQVNYILSLVIIGAPYVFHQAGWIGGFGLYALYLVVMAQTAKWVCRSIEVAGKGTEAYPAASTPDLVRIVFGEGLVSGAVTVAFFLDLFGTLVISVTVIAESIVLLIPSDVATEYDVTSTDLKLLSLPILIFMAHMPLERLSMTSIFGTTCAFGVFGVLIFNGLTKPSQPGSLWDVEHMTTRLWPPAQSNNFWQGPLGCLAMATGIVVTTTSGHAGLPRMYMALKKREKSMAIWIEWGFGFSVLVMVICGAVGYAMFGEDTREAITDNLTSMGHNATLNFFL
ncbi:hypothetical protein HDU93_003134 [Gonapodya sp. JEL0774]|nr:hypothetical protein HDU93_003134 [Gonapodya sp. JEL0774]